MKEGQGAQDMLRCVLQSLHDSARSVLPTPALFFTHVVCMSRARTGVTPLMPADMMTFSSAQVAAEVAAFRQTDG